ncbi:MAG: branched-chain amino acid ABC transporter permease [Pelagibacterales bacterium]|nr:branched-chain amino acid ABC transporter permease [Pelagibacterales bacterium]MBL6861555.1 branched-chain amino acid ABC transporter permease [Pelagibacterales bacterium]
MDIINALVLLSNFVLLPAITYGSQLALAALGVTLIYAVLRFSNFAHGDLMSFGTMVTILITWWLQSIGITGGIMPTALIALPFGILITALLCLLIDQSVYKFYRKQKSVPVVFMIVSVGVMFTLNALVRFIIGPDDRRFFDGEKFIIKAVEFKNLTGLDEGLAIKSTQVITIIVAIITMLILFWFLQKSKTGKSMRAFSNNEDLALLSGINPDRVVMYTWIIVGALATIAGVLYGLDKSFKPYTYFSLVLPMFAAAIIGGVGNPLGAIVGGYIIGFSEVMLTYTYKKFLIYILPTSLEPSGLMQFLSTDYKFAISFIILVIVLIVRPTGIFKGKTL